MLVEVRRLVPALPGSVWRVLAVDMFSAMGSGLTVPFLVVYLHQVRGLSLAAAGAAAACVAVAGLAGNPAGGWLADRVGPSRAVAVGLLTAGVGAVLLAGVSQLWQALPAAALSGLGVAIAWPAQDALLARLAGVARRSSVFALRHLTSNLGLGAGGAVAAFVVDAARPGTFVAMYLLDAVSFVLAAVVLLTVTTLPCEPTGGGRVGAGYRWLLRDGVFVRVWVLTALMITVGYGAFQVALPAVVTGPGGVSASWLGVAFTANTLTVVLAQLGVLRLLRGRRRTRAVRWAAAAWAGTWLLVLAVAGAGEGAAVVWLIAAAVVFALGETLLSPTVPAIVNDIAPEPLRGRYNGGLTLAYTTGFIVGPLLCGLALGHGSGSLLLCLGLVSGCAVGAMLATGLERRLPASANLVPPPDPAPVQHPIPAEARS